MLLINDHDYNETNWENLLAIILNFVWESKLIKWFSVIEIYWACMQMLCVTVNMIICHNDDMISLRMKILLMSMMMITLSSFIIRLHSTS